MNVAGHILHVGWGSPCANTEPATHTAATIPDTVFFMMHSGRNRQSIDTPGIGIYYSSCVFASSVTSRLHFFVGSSARGTWRSRLHSHRRRGNSFAVRVGCAEEQREQDEDGGRAGGRNHPDAFPGMRPLSLDETVDDAPGCPRADEHPDAERDERDEALRRGAQIARGPAVHVDLSGNEEEIVADAVEENAGVEHPH